MQVAIFCEQRWDDRGRVCQSEARNGGVDRDSDWLAAAVKHSSLRAIADVNGDWRYKQPKQRADAVEATMILK